MMKGRPWKKTTEIEKLLSNKIPTQKELASRLGVTQRGLRNMFSDPKKLLKHLPVICEITGESPNSIVYILTGYSHVNKEK